MIPKDQKHNAQDATYDAEDAQYPTPNLRRNRFAQKLKRHTCRDYTTTKRLHLITQSSFCPPLARLDVSCVASGGLEHRLTSSPTECVCHRQTKTVPRKNLKREGGLWAKNSGTCSQMLQVPPLHSCPYMSMTFHDIRAVTTLQPKGYISSLRAPFVRLWLGWMFPV